MYYGMHKCMLSKINLGLIVTGRLDYRIAGNFRGTIFSCFSANG